MDKFEKECQKEKDEITESIKKDDLALKEKQEKELDDFEKEFEENFSKLNIVTPPEVLDLEKKKETLVKQKKFKDAQFIQNQIEELNNKNNEKWKKEKEKKYKNEKNKLLKKFANETNVFKSKNTFKNEEFENKKNKKLMEIEHKYLVREKQIKSQLLNLKSKS